MSNERQGNPKRQEKSSGGLGGFWGLKLSCADLNACFEVKPPSEGLNHGKVSKCWFKLVDLALNESGVVRLFSFIFLSISLFMKCFKLEKMANTL